MNRFSIMYATIASGEVLSGVMEVVGAKSIGLLATIPVSCVAYLNGSFDISSSNFRRISKIDGSGDWNWAVGSGKKAIDIDDVALAFPYLKFETSVAQPVTSLAIITKY